MIIDLSGFNYSNEIPELGAQNLAAFLANVKFGDVVVNGHASEQNPRRIGIFVKCKPKKIQLTDGLNFWDIYTDKESRFVIVGSILKEKR